MIDLHSHILPDLDDGAPDLDASLAMARRAVEEGIATIVATPHVNSEYDPDPADIQRRVGNLNRELAGRSIELKVVPGAEVALSRALELTPDDLAQRTIGAGRWLLLESPYQRAVPFMEQAIFELQVAGFKLLLAHPERAPAFQADPDRVGVAVGRGVACAVNATSLAAARVARPRARVGPRATRLGPCDLLGRPRRQFAPARARRGGQGGRHRGGGGALAHRERARGRARRREPPPAPRPATP